IAKAAACAGLTDPSTRPAMNPAISSALRVLPSRFFAMISCGRTGTSGLPEPDRRFGRPHEDALGRESELDASGPPPRLLAARERVLGQQRLYGCHGDVSGLVHPRQAARKGDALDLDLLAHAGPPQAPWGIQMFLTWVARVRK